MPYPEHKVYATAETLLYEAQRHFFRYATAFQISHTPEELASAASALRAAGYAHQILREDGRARLLLRGTGCHDQTYGIIWSTEPTT